MLLTPLIVLMYDRFLFFLDNFNLWPLCFFLLKRKRFTQMDTIISPSLHSCSVYLISLYCTQQLVSSTSWYLKTNSKCTPCTPPVVSCRSCRYTGGWLSWPWWGRSPAWRCSQGNNWQCQTLTDTWKTKKSYANNVYCKVGYREPSLQIVLRKVSGKVTFSERKKRQ